MRLPWILALMTLSASCGSHKEEPVSEQKWMTGAGPARGHEDITRLAVDRANDALQGQIGYRPYPSIAKGVAGIDTGNAMVRGNFETDFPSRRMKEFHKMPDNVDWHNDGRIQHIHSLRDFAGGQPLGLRDSCVAIRTNILDAARQAIASYQAGHTEDGQYWLGHAAHVIQDSFSPAHSERHGAGRQLIGNICVYGIDVPGLCKHDSVDVRDRIWRSKFSCQMDPNNRGYSCLKDEAQDAVNATAAFLVNAGGAIFAGKALDESLQGYFACESLSP
ncbi:hypothetical protein [Oligoflexus tunisiensis]|uniref:hypothetical protein n=1 Tax=Oligoflexus tunisiensis TaxID=708132 RepID=UPI00114CAAF9|nr:hypothetical protein [Oligoflexus tunisiensis]